MATLVDKSIRTNSLEEALKTIKGLAAHDATRQIDFSGTVFPLDEKGTENRITVSWKSEEEVPTAE